MIKKFNNIDDMIDYLKSINLKNETILNNLIKTYQFINKKMYKNILCSISGGADSDILLDICYRCDIENKCKYVYFDTGLEYEATKRHISYLEQKYGISIEREKAIVPIPTCVKKYGEPFLSKQVSQYIEGLQRHGFDFVDRPFDELYSKYPRCKSALQWWCNLRQNGNDKRFCIAQNKWLKEFLIEYPPKFKISGKCCNYAKKGVAKRYIKQHKCDLDVMGIRKAEGGVRATTYKTCFLEGWENDLYMPIFWYSNSDKEEYKKLFDIQNSECYTKYGFKRTGCCCCPFGYATGLKDELKKIKQYEPKMHKAVTSVFRNSYEYTKKYERFKKTNAKEVQ